MKYGKMWLRVITCLLIISFLSVETGWGAECPIEVAGLAQDSAINSLYKYFNASSIRLGYSLADCFVIYKGFKNIEDTLFQEGKRITKTNIMKVAQQDNEEFEKYVVFKGSFRRRSDADGVIYYYIDVVLRNGNGREYARRVILYDSAAGQIPMAYLRSSSRHGWQDEDERSARGRGFWICALNLDDKIKYKKEYLARVPDDAYEFYTLALMLMVKEDRDKVKLGTEIFVALAKACILDPANMAELQDNFPDLVPVVEEKMRQRLQVVSSAAEITGVSLSDDEERVVAEIRTKLTEELDRNDERHIVDILNVVSGKVSSPAAEAIGDLVAEIDKEDGVIDYNNLAYQAVVAVVRSWPKAHYHAHVGSSIHGGFVWNEMVQFKADLFDRFRQAVAHSVFEEDEQQRRMVTLEDLRQRGVLWHEIEQGTQREILELFYDKCTRKRVKRDAGVYDLGSWQRMITHVALEHFADGVRDLRLLINVSKKFEPDRRKIIKAALAGFVQAEKLACARYGGSFSAKLVASFARHDVRYSPEEVNKILDEMIELREEGKGDAERILGIDISGGEGVIDMERRLRKTSDYRDVFRKARAHGMITNTHIGDWGHTYRRLPNDQGEFDEDQVTIAGITDREERVRRYLEFIEDAVRSGNLGTVLHGTALAPQGSVITKGVRRPPYPEYQSFAGEAIEAEDNLAKIEEILAYIRRHDIEMRTCPTANNNSQQVVMYQRHPFHQWLLRGLRVAIDCDDFYWGEVPTTLSDDIAKMMLAAPRTAPRRILTPRLAMIRKCLLRGLQTAIAYVAPYWDKVPPTISNNITKMMLAVSRWGSERILTPRVAWEMSLPVAVQPVARVLKEARIAEDLIQVILDTDSVNRDITVTPALLQSVISALKREGVDNHIIGRLLVGIVSLDNPEIEAKKVIGLAHDIAVFMNVVAESDIGMGDVLVDLAEIFYDLLLGTAGDFRKELEVLTQYIERLKSTGEKIRTEKEVSRVMSPRVAKSIVKITVLGSRGKASGHAFVVADTERYYILAIAGHCLRHDLDYFADINGRFVPIEAVIRRKPDNYDGEDIALFLINKARFKSIMEDEAAVLIPLELTSEFRAGQMATLVTSDQVSSGCLRAMVSGNALLLGANSKPGYSGAPWICLGREEGRDIPYVVAVNSRQGPIGAVFTPDVIAEMIGTLDGDKTTAYEVVQKEGKEVVREFLGGIIPASPVISPVSEILVTPYFAKLADGDGTNISP